MRKQTISMAALACVFVLSFTSINAAATPTETWLTPEAKTGDIRSDAVETGVSADNAEKSAETRTTDDADTPNREPSKSIPADAETGGVEAAIPGTGGQGRMTAEQLKAEKNSSTGNMAADAHENPQPNTADTVHGADNPKGVDPEYDAMEEKTSYTAPEDNRHANVSFTFTESAASAFFSRLTYPLSLSLKEVDTGDKLKLTIKSAGQILEVEKGDYVITSLKDSGKVPLSVAGDTLHIYESTTYPVRFAANNTLKMFTDFLADNIFLACFFIIAALLYKKAIISRFANDVGRH